MAKLALTICLLSFFLISCNQNPDCQTQTSQKAEESATAACPTEPSPEVPTPTEPSEPTPTDPDEEVPHEALIFDAKIDLYEFDAEDEHKLSKAIEIIKKVIATKEFRNKVLNFTYKGKKEFVDSKGLTNAQIYQKLLDGSETLKPEVDHEMDLELQLYYSLKNVVGYTYPNVLRIYMNTKYFDVYSPAEVAGNVFHEWTHKIGFTHASSYSVSRDSSVPYALGYLIRDLGKQYE